MSSQLYDFFKQALKGKILCHFYPKIIHPLNTILEITSSKCITKKKFNKYQNDDLATKKIFSARLARFFLFSSFTATWLENVKSNDFYTDDLLLDLSIFFFVFHAIRWQTFQGQ